MVGRPSRLDVALIIQEEHIEVALVALADGWQPEDEPVIRAALIGIRSQFPEIDDVGQDLKAIRRCVTVGRHLVFDERFRARDNDIERTRLEYRKVDKLKATLRVKLNVARREDRR